jgi:hypothetical protein
MDSIIQTGLRGIQVGTESAANNADRVTRAFSPESIEDPVEPLIDLKANERQVEASAKVVQVGNRMLGAILDILG